MARERVEFDVIGRDQGGSKAFKDVGDAADKAGDKVDGLGKSAKDTGDKVDKSGEQAEDASKEYRGLAAAIEEARSEMHRLATEIDKTGNMDLSKDLRKQQSELRKLMNVKKVMGDAGSDGAAAFSVSFVQRVGPLLARAPLSPYLVGAAVAAAPFMASVLAGAVMGGIATGVAGAGIAIAAQDAEVQAAGKKLGATLSEGFKDAAKPFVPATLAAIVTVESRFLQLKPAIADIFDDAAEYVEPLTDAVLGFVENVVPGIGDAVDEADSFFSMLGRELPELGTDVGEFVGTLAENADEGAEAIGTLLDATGAFVDTASFAVDAAIKMGNAFAWLQEQTDVSPDRGETEKKWFVLKKGADEGGGALRRLIGAFNGTTTAAASVNAEFRTLSQLVDEIVDKNISAAEAELRMKEAVDAAAKAVDGKRTVSDAEQGSLTRLARSLNDTTKAMDETGVSADEAAAAHGRNRKQLYDAARAAGYTKAEAWKLADQWLKVPKNVKTKATADTQAALSALQKLHQYKIPNKTFYINGIYRELRVSGQGSAGGFANNAAEGGLMVGPGTGTSDDIVTRVSNGEYVVRAGAVRAIGVDNLDRLNQADRNPGALASATAGSSSSGRGGGNAALARTLEAAVERGTLRALQKMPIVRLDDARIAGLYTRTG